MPTEIALTWPAAFAVVGGIVAAGIGLNTLLSNRRDVSAIAKLEASVKEVDVKHMALDARVNRLETTLEGQVATKFEHLNESIGRVEDKMDTLVSEVVSALSKLAAAMTQPK